jgi:hypothetical protein
MRVSGNSGILIAGRDDKCHLPLSVTMSVVLIVERAAARTVRPKRVIPDPDRAVRAARSSIFILKRPGMGSTRNMAGCFS